MRLEAKRGIRRYQKNGKSFCLENISSSQDEEHCMRKGSERTTGQKELVALQ